jgi:hypothetical protein
VFKVVEHEQRTAGTQVEAERLGNRLAPRLFQAESLGDCGRHEPGIGQAHEAYEPDTVGEIVQQFGGDLDCEARLADATGSGQGEEPGVNSPEQRDHRSDRLVATEQMRKVRRHVMENVTEQRTFPACGRDI